MGSRFMRNSAAHVQRIRIIGLGNTLRGDDAVGIIVARRLRGQVNGGVEVREAEMAGIEMLDLLRNVHAAILVDAMRSGEPPGVVRRFDASASSISRTLFPSSTHALSALDAVELARALGFLPPRVIVFGIEVEKAGHTQGSSSPVVQAVDRAVSLIVRDVKAFQHA